MRFLLYASLMFLLLGLLTLALTSYYYKDPAPRVPSPYSLELEDGL